MKKYVLFGAGDFGRKAAKFLGLDKVECFCDNNLVGEVDGLAIIDYPKLKQIHRGLDVVIAVANCRYRSEIANQLAAEKIPFLSFEEAAASYIQSEADIYNAACRRKTFMYDEKSKWFIAGDRMDEAATIDSYFWQDMWAARHIFEARPDVHCDIGSRVDGLIAHLASFHQKVILLDIRPFHANIPNVDFLQCDATNMDNIADNSIESLSALCSLEHFGLGRYGDPIDPEACFKCFSAITRKIRPGGYAYISVPIGKEHLEFNAHRVFYADTIRTEFSPLELVEFSSCYGENMEHNIDLHKYDQWTKHGGERFGLFRFRKK